MWHYWISASVERDENIKRERPLTLLHRWIYGTVEWDENVKSDYRTEFVTLLYKCDCWKGWECNTR